MTAPTFLGAFPQAPDEPLSAIELSLVPIDLVSEWRRCGMTADFVAEYMAQAFERRETARSVVSTVVNELVENAAKFSADKRAPARLAFRLHGNVVHVEVENEATAAHVDRLGELLSALASDDAGTVFRRRFEARLGLGLALIARDYGAAIGATVARADGRITVCLRIALDATEVEQR